MKVSIITPFYKGNAYMRQYAEMIQRVEQHLAYNNTEDELEVILVNDSPDVEIIIPQGAPTVKSLRILQNETNQGIHKSRIRGLEESNGDYVMFLDQDDVLAEQAITSLLREAKSHPKAVVVANALLEQKDTSELWYRTDYHKERVGDYRTYLTIGTQIISPGQCLIPRNLIPDIWKEKCCTVNGSDDYYLWLLLLQQGVSFRYLDEPLYIHRYTAENLSADTTKTDASVYEFVTFLQEAKALPEKDIELLLRMIRYKDAFRRGNLITKAVETIKHLDLFMENLRFKLGTKTPYGFNR